VEVRSFAVGERRTEWVPSEDHLQVRQVVVEEELDQGDQVENLLLEGEVFRTNLQVYVAAAAAVRVVERTPPEEGVAVHGMVQSFLAVVGVRIDHFLGEAGFLG